MEITLIVVGKTTEDYLITGTKKYDQKINHYIKFNQEVIASIKKANNKDKQQLKIMEGTAILSKLKTSDVVILLDEKGKNLDSVGFSHLLQKQLNKGLKRLVFIIGGAYGFSEAVYKRANDKIALSPMTFSHQMVRLIFREQLYRGCAILKNEPYHHQ